MTAAGEHSQQSEEIMTGLAMQILEIAGNRRLSRRYFGSLKNCRLC
jgi:hypothetical protein